MQPNVTFQNLRTYVYASNVRTYVCILIVLASPILSSHQHDYIPHSISRPYLDITGLGASICTHTPTRRPPGFRAFIVVADPAIADTMNADHDAKSHLEHYLSYPDRYTD